MASSITVPHNLMLDRILTMEIVRVTERAAVNAARLRGRGEEKAADQAAVDAMRRELNNLPIDGTVVIGCQMQCRLVVDTDEKRERVAKMGIKDPRKKYQIEDMVRGDCLFAATGITDGRMLQGVRFGNGIVARFRCNSLPWRLDADRK